MLNSLVVYEHEDYKIAMHTISKKICRNVKLVSHFYA